MARKPASSAAAKAVADRRAVLDEANAEAMHRMDSVRPTPTQEENDLAKVGASVDEKEDHGAEPQAPVAKVVEPAAVTSAPYQTRVAKPD